jgi:MFS family permease
VLNTESTGSQIPLYFVAGTLSFIAADFGEGDLAAWMPIVYSIVLAAIASFCSYLQDLFGRRNITLARGVIIYAGIIIVATAHSVRQVITGMGLMRRGAAIGELTALTRSVDLIAKPSGGRHFCLSQRTSEIAAVNRRGVYLALVTRFILPFSPWSLYTKFLAN